MKRRTSGTWAIAALAAVLVLAFLLFRSVAVEAAYPAERAAHALSEDIGPRLSGFFDGVRAAAENVTLRRENARLRMIERENADLRAENARLRESLGAAKRLGADWLPAGVLSRGGGAAGVRRTLRLGRGSRDGVAVGQCAAVPSGLVGLVTSVTPHTSEVTLLADPSIKVACDVEAAGPRVRGIACGGDERLLDLRHVTRPGAVRAGAKVVTSGLGGVFPKGIPIGTVSGGDGDVPAPGAVARNAEEGRSPRGGGVLAAAGQGGLDFEIVPAVDGATLEEVFVRRER